VTINTRRIFVYISLTFVDLHWPPRHKAKQVAGRRLNAGLC